VKTWIWSTSPGYRSFSRTTRSIASPSTLKVTFADRAAVQFLASAEAAGIRIVNCPRYVRTWIAAETESQTQRIEEQDK